MLTVTDTKTGSVLTFVGNRYISNDARNNTLSGTYHVLQNGKRTPMQEMTREQVDQTVAKMRAAGLVVTGELEG